jgi:hypothetical protein
MIVAKQSECVQVILKISCNPLLDPKVHYRFHKSPTYDYPETHESSPHYHILYLLTLILSFHQRLCSKWSLPFRFSD